MPSCLHVVYDFFHVTWQIGAQLLQQRSMVHKTKTLIIWSFTEKVGCSLFQTMLLQSEMKPYLDSVLFCDTSKFGDILSLCFQKQGSFQGINKLLLF